jgi:hypothetical protein
MDPQTAQIAQMDDAWRRAGYKLATCFHHTEQVFYCQAASLCAVVCRCVPCTMFGKRRGNGGRKWGKGDMRTSTEVGKASSAKKRQGDSFADGEALSGAALSVLGIPIEQLFIYLAQEIGRGPVG